MRHRRVSNQSIPYTVSDSCPSVSVPSQPDHHQYFYRSLTQQAVNTVSAADEPTSFKPVPIPDDAQLGTFAGSALVALRTDWQPPGAPGGATFKAGALIAAPMDAVMREDWSGAHFVVLGNA